MSAWILGSEIAASLGLRDFEFARESYTEPGQFAGPGLTGTRAVLTRLVDTATCCTSRQKRFPTADRLNADQKTGFITWTFPDRVTVSPI